MEKDTIKGKISKIHNELSPKEIILANYILKNPKSASKMTINEIASELMMANSTVFQFTRKLGYKGFRDFRNDLLTEEFDPSISIQEELEEGDDSLSVAKKIFYSSIRTLYDTASLLDFESLEKASKLMMQSVNVSFFGLGGSNVVANDAYHKFLRSPIHCQYATDFHVQLMQASRLNFSDCAIIISHSGITKDAKMIAEEVKNHEAKLIVITSDPLTKLADMADVVLVSSSEETEYRTEPLASRLAQITLLDSLLTIVMFKEKEKSQDSLYRIRGVLNKTKEEIE